MRSYNHAARSWLRVIRYVNVERIKESHDLLVIYLLENSHKNQCSLVLIDQTKAVFLVQYDFFNCEILELMLSFHNFIPVGNVLVSVKPFENELLPSVQHACVDDRHFAY